MALKNIYIIEFIGLQFNHESSVQPIIFDVRLWMDYTSKGSFGRQQALKILFD
jgi:hypothetical protein